MELHNLASPGRLQMTNLFGASPLAASSRSDLARRLRRLTSMLEESTTWLSTPPAVR